MSSNLKAHAALFSANLIYAANYGIAKDVMGGGFVHPYTFILFRAIGACLLFWAWWYFSRKEYVEKRDYFRLILGGLFGVATNQLLFFQGLSLTNEISASIIMTTNPILVLVMAAFILKEKLTAKKILGILIGLAGAIYLIATKKSSGKEASMLGDLLILLNATSYGLYLIIITPLMKKYNPFTVVRWVFTFGLVFVLPFGLYKIGETNWEMNYEIVLKILYVVVFTTFFAYVFNISALRQVSPTVVSAYIYLQPLLTTIIAIMIRQSDTLTWDKILSALLIFTGVYLVSVKKISTIK